MTIRQDFYEKTKLKNIWNKIIVFNGLNIATVMWHTDREWKVVKEGAGFDEIKERDYEPIFECHTQKELWDYIKNIKK